MASPVNIGNSIPPIVIRPRCLYLPLFITNYGRVRAPTCLIVIHMSISKARESEMLFLFIFHFTTFHSSSLRLHSDKYYVAEVAAACQLE